MKITYPYMAYYSPVFQNLFEGLGNEVVPPPKPTRRTLDLATKYSPEFACLPLKILLGSYVEALDMGADTIISTGGVGPCRAGYYTLLQEKILRSLGYQFRVFTLEPPKGHVIQLLKTIKAFINVPPWKVLSAVRTTWAKLYHIDDLERVCHHQRPLETDVGTCTKILEEGVDAIDAANSVRDIRRAGAEYARRLNEVEIDEGRRPLKVGVIGEIYVVLEPFANFNVIEVLNSMGVYAHRSIFLTDWTRENAILDAFRIKPEKAIRACAKPYLNEPVGGHGENSIGETVRYGKLGYDGVIQLAPFSCIPEIVAKSILPKVSRDHNIPVMTLTLDEQTGIEGVTTRLEAFVDLMARRRSVLGEAVV